MGDLDAPAHRLFDYPAKPASNVRELLGCFDRKAVAKRDASADHRDCDRSRDQGRFVDSEQPILSSRAWQVLFACAGAWPVAAGTEPERIMPETPLQPVARRLRMQPSRPIRRPRRSRSRSRGLPARRLG